MSSGENTPGGSVPRSSKPSMDVGEWGLLVVLSILWGGSFFFVAIAVKELPTFTVVVSRVALAALCLLAVMKFVGAKFPTDRGTLGAFLVMGALNNAIPFALIVWGQAHIASAIASILNATTPFFTALVAHWATDQEKLTLNRVVGMLVAFGGVAAMVGGDALAAMDVNVWAQLAVLAAAFSYALAGVYGRRFRRLNVAPLAAATGQVSASSLILIPLMLLVDRPWSLPAPGIETVASLVALAVLSTAVAYLIYFRILSSAGAVNLLLVTFLVPVSATLLGVFILDEQLFAKHFAGMALIGVGLVAYDGRLVKLLRAKSGGTPRS